MDALTFLINHLRVAVYTWTLYGKLARGLLTRPSISFPLFLDIKERFII
jgi:hypothetical protein